MKKEFILAASQVLLCQWCAICGNIQCKSVEFKFFLASPINIGKITTTLTFRCCSCLEDTWIHGKWFFFRSVIHDIVDNPFFEWTVLLLIFASRWNLLLRAQNILIHFLFQSLTLFRGHQPAGQWGTEIHSEDSQPHVRRVVYCGDVSQVDCFRPQQIFLQCVDLPWFCYCLGKSLNFIRNITI